MRYGMKMKEHTTTDSVVAKKSLGQHFLTSDIVPRWMCDAGGVKEGEIILEIGAGTGVLTAELLRRGVTLYAIEADRRSIDILTQRFANEIKNEQLHIYTHDIRDGIPVALIEQMSSYKVVANIPYYLTGELFRLFLEKKHQPTDIVFLVQKEIAERIARDSKKSLLSLSVQVFGVPKYIRTVKRGHFNPPPKVDSAIIHIENIGHHHLSPEETPTFFKVLRAGFAHKRKFLVSNLSTVYPKKVILEVFETLDISPSTRAETVNLKEWLSIYRALGDLS